MNNKELKKLLTALNVQGWTCEHTPNGHYKMWPPDRNKPMVCAATNSNDINIFNIIVRDLRKSGFVWPWPPASRNQKPVEEKTMHVVSPPKVTEVPVSTPTESANPDMDALFRQLKEARNYAQLAREAKEEALEVVNKAGEALRGSVRELELAETQLKAAKSAFDKAFGGEE